MAVAVLCIGAASQAPRPIASGADSPAQAADEVGAVLARLQEKARDQSCTVNYRMTSKGQTSALRLAYRAPDRFKFEMHRDAERMDAWVFADRWVVRKASESDSFSADFDPAKVWDAAEFDRVLAQEFPLADTAAPALGSGGCLSLRLHPDKPAAGDKYIELQLDWLTRRAHPLEWLASTDPWGSARVEAGHLIREYPSGARATLSTEHGWPDELKHPLGSSLELVDFKTGVKDSDFEVPAHSEGMRDVTKDWISGAGRTRLAAQRTSVYVRAARSMEDKAHQHAALQARLQRVFESLYAPEMRRSFTSWSEQISTGIDRMAEWCTQQLARISDDPKLRAEFDTQVASWKAQLPRDLAASIEKYVGELSAFADDRVAPAHVPVIFPAEQAGLRAAFRREIADSLLTKLDARLREVGALK